MPYFAITVDGEVFLEKRNKQGLWRHLMDNGIFFRIEAYNSLGEMIDVSFGGAKEKETHVLGSKSYRALINEQVEYVILAVESDDPDAPIPNKNLRQRMCE